MAKQSGSLLLESRLVVVTGTVAKEFPLQVKDSQSGGVAYTLRSDGMVWL